MASRPKTDAASTRLEVDRARSHTWRYRLRDRLVALLLPVAERLLRLLPKVALTGLGTAAARCYRLVARRDMAILRANLEHVLKLAPRSPAWRSLRRRVTEQQVAAVLETVRELLVPGTVEIFGREALGEVIATAQRAGRGFVLVTAHLGSWELVIGEVARATNGHFHVLAKRSRTAPVTRWLERLRERVGAQVLWNDDRALPRKMLRGLERGDGIGLAMDQKPRWYQGPVVELFGLPTEFVGGPAALAARTQCPVLAVFCVREAPFRYRLLAEQLYSSEHGERDPLRLTQTMASAIERVVRAHLDQWCWTYKRWLFDAEGNLRRGGAQARRTEAELEDAEADLEDAETLAVER
jgi:KDO2-lipid IV(A) lauroyltransferase